MNRLFALLLAVALVPTALASDTGDDSGVASWASPVQPAEAKPDASGPMNALPPDPGGPVQQVPLDGGLALLALAGAGLAARKLRQ